ncbi:hypothetical protein U732_3620 [Clostridium argentinense CDC 2741]|uniref:Swt1-like HEPN domain-containing protein n=1 Tax=Clostridium argentinense CDC 2741 TaxID=1418104 RepID=A0A0C1U4U2_9CLOT|nr:hypothetical protein [Clostridium argentinense]ARC86224.1 hypothetical protein RSJ17_17870 [Clostridium argentinense]KIE47784.1 hypothetical protein U732_3620 [Clostridium argentinense CDC 2741]NFF40259.1 hypothetical protein [Clostridium argentinense]NFP50068.1 hypothetical protein [Clostridium argentinense]NFP74613.1 hypothetical protein [Clostridium argentinense]
MDTIVKFCMVNTKNSIENRKNYLENMMRKFVDSGDILEIVPYVFEGPFGGNIQQSCMWAQDDSFEYKIRHKENKKNVFFMISFSFETYDSSERLSIEISSKDYVVEVKDQKSYLERLKEMMSKRLLADWEKCIWLYDRESEVFATELYPMIHRTENKMRHFINEVMIVIKGVDWWEKLVPKNIKAKLKKSKTKDSTDSSKDKISTYKALAPAFRHVDEKMLLIDVGDLLSIITLKERKLSTINSTKINSIINGLEEFDFNAIQSELCKSAEVSLDLWQDCFSKYLSEAFINNFRKFEDNRNHIAHNKMINRQAFESIRDSIEVISDELDVAMNKFKTENLPQEIISIIEEAEAAEEQEYKDTLEEIIETETGLTRRNRDEIIGMFDEYILEFYHSLESNFSFKADIEFSNFSGIIYQDEEQELFRVKYKITDDELIVCCKLDINDNWGDDSRLNLKWCHGEHNVEYSIGYSNGDYEYNSEQGYYMPHNDEVFEQELFEYAVNEIMEYIELNFQNMREIIDSTMYRIVKDGGNSPVADLYCYECGEEYICVDETIAKKGLCLNCGQMNDICECERCGNYYEGRDSAYEDDEPRLCDICMKHYANE